MPALKRIMSRVELPGALKRSYPRINAGASTQRLRTGLFSRPVKSSLDTETLELGSLRALTIGFETGITFL